MQEGDDEVIYEQKVKNKAKTIEGDVLHCEIKGKSLPIFYDDGTPIQYYSTVLAYDATPNYSNESTASTTVTGVDVIPPSISVITSFTVVAKKGKNKLSWVFNPLPRDADEWVIYRNVTDNSETAEELDRVKAKGNRNSGGKRTYTDDTSDLEGGETYYYWLALEDESGNLSSLIAVGDSAPLPNPTVNNSIIFLNHFDGNEPIVADFTGNTVDVFGAAPTTRSGGVIFRPGKFGKGVQIAESVTNLIKNPSFEVDLSSWSSYGLTMSRITTDALIGSACQKLYVAANPDSYAYIFPNYFIPISPSTTYMLSFWVKAIASVPSGFEIEVDWYNASFELISVETYPISLSGTFAWTKYVQSLTSQSGITYAVIYINTGYFSTELHLLTDAWQFAQTNYDLPYCDGSLGNGHSWSDTAHNSYSTRTTSLLAYNSNILNQEAGTFFCYYKPNVATQTGATRVLFDLRDQYNTSALVLYHDHSDNRFKLLVGGITMTCDAATLIAGENYFIRVTYNYSTDIYRVYFNETLIGNFNDIISQPTYGAAIRVGSNYLGSELCNGILDEFAFCNAELSADEGKNIYLSNAPVQVDISNLEDKLPPYPDPPTGMANGTVTVVNARTGKMECTVSWSPCDDTGSPPVDYEVEWGYQSDLSDAETIKKGFVTSGSTVSVTFKVLESSMTKSTVYWRVRAYDKKKNYTTFCAIQNFALTDDVTIPVTISGTMGISGIGAMDVMFNLNTTDKDMQSYKIYVNTSASMSGAKTIRDVPHGSFILYGKGRVTIPVGSITNDGYWTIEYDQVYYFAVCPVDRAGNENTTDPIFTAPIKAIHLEIVRQFNIPWKLAGLGHVKKDTLATNHSPPSGKVWGLLNHQLNVNTQPSGYTTTLGMNGITVDYCSFASEPVAYQQKRNPKFNAGIYLDSSDILYIQSLDPAGTGWFKVQQYNAMPGVEVVNFEVNLSYPYTVTTGKDLFLTFVSPYTGDDLEVSVDGGSTWVVLIFEVTANKHTMGDGVFVVPSGGRLRASSGTYIQCIGIEMAAE